MSKSSEKQINVSNDLKSQVRDQIMDKASRLITLKRESILGTADNYGMSLCMYDSIYNQVHIEVMCKVHDMIYDDALKQV